MTVKRLFLTLQFGVAAALGVTSTATSAATVPDLEQAVDRFVESQRDKHGIPGIAVAIVEEGRIVHAEGYGSAGGGRSMTADTPMHIGSTTKVFTAVAILQLVEQSDVGLDAPVRTYLPWFRVADDEASRTITVRDLLNHTSGLSELGYNRVLSAATSLEEGVRDLASARSTEPVGETLQYFNPNYATLALIIETVSGGTFEEFVTERIFEPLDMSRSFVNQDDARDAGMAQGHGRFFGLSIARDQPFLPARTGAANIISTATDLSRFLIALDNGGVHDGARILSAESVRLMRSATVEVGDAAYGLGWAVAAPSDGERWEGHGGLVETFSTDLALLPREHRGFVWLMNQAHILDPARIQLSRGMRDLVQGREPDSGGMSMKTLGLLILTVLIVLVAFAVRSFLKLRRWTERSRTMSRWGVAWKIAPHVIVPVVVLAVAYRLMGPLVLGEPRAFNFRNVGFYYMPDVTLVILLAVIPGLVQAAYMSAAVAVDRVIKPAVRENRDNDS